MKVMEFPFHIRVFYIRYSLTRKCHIKASVHDGAALTLKAAVFLPFKPPLKFHLFHVPEVLLGWIEQELLALAFAALMVMSHICVGRSPLQPVTHAYLWEMQQLKHQLTNPCECTVTSECFQQMLPVTSLSTASRIKAWWSELGDVHEHLLKEAWESMVTAKPAVEINIIGVRLNFLNLRPAFYHQRN